MVMQNAWLIYRTYKQDDDVIHDLLSYRREIVNAYVVKYKERNVIPRRRTTPWLQRRYPTTYVWMVSTISKKTWGGIDVALSVKEGRTKGVKSATKVA